LPDGGGPQYLAIVRALAADVAEGRLHAGDRLPTHRQLARALGLGLGTVTRAYKEALQGGLIASRVGRGTFVASASAANPLGLPSSRAIEMSVDLPLHAEDPDLAAALKKIARRGETQALLRYGDHAGSARHRRAGAAWLERCELPVGADEVVVCAGTHHALCVALATIAKAGEVVLCDALCYPGLRALANRLQLKLSAIPSPGGDLDARLAAIEAACRKQRVRAIYCTPSVHNPTTARMEVDERRALAHLADEHGFHVLEDDVHRLLGDGPPPPVATLARERSFYVASFSKAVVPGLRVAFLVPPPGLLRRTAESVWATTWTVPPLPVEVAATWIEDGTADRVVARKRREAGERQGLCASLLAGARIDAQSCSYFAWLHLPEPWTSVEFALEARARGVAVTPSTAFAMTDAPAPPAVRVCVAAPATREEAERGLGILRALLDDGPSRTSAS